MSTGNGSSRRLQLDLLQLVIQFMSKSGISERSIHQAFQQSVLAISEQRKQRAFNSGAYLPNGDVSADVLRLWHRNGRYIDSIEAKPKPLSLSKGRQSIYSLVRVVSADADPRQVVSFMKSAKLIVKTSSGRYVPASEDAGTITRDDPFVVEHLARSVIRLFSTVRRNTANVEGWPPLIERYAYVSDLSPSDMNAFAEFTKAQGLVYLKAVDDWMEQRRSSRRRSSRKVRSNGLVAGVQVVAYLGDSSVLPRQTPKSRRRGGSEGTDGGSNARTPTSPP